MGRLGILRIAFARLAITALLLAVFNNAAATPIAVFAGDVVVLNYDFAAAGVTPTPPYPRVRWELRVSDFAVGDSGFVEIFSDVNLQGGTLTSGIFGGFDASAPGIADGRFSVRFEATSGAFTIDPAAFALDANENRITADVFATTVPEPATLGLFGIALAALGCRRRSAIKKSTLLLP